MKCDSCEVANINGVRCHETGCPDAWKDELRDCKECGSEFEPRYSDQLFCSGDCSLVYNGFGIGNDYDELDDDSEFDDGVREWGDWRDDMLADEMDHDCEANSYACCEVDNCPPSCPHEV